MSEPRVCVDRDLHPDHHASAAARAVALRPDNLAPALEMLARLGPADPPVAGLAALAPHVRGAVIPAQLVGLVGKYWPVGATVKVRFLDGSPRLRARVAAAVEEGPDRSGGWPQVANIRFDWAEAPDADIRVSFGHDAGSWSLLGTDCREVAEGEPTLNLGWLRDDTPDSEFHVCLHEFGHAIGFGHEHESPVAGIPWDVEKAIRWYQATQGWSRPMVIQQVFDKYSEAQTNHGDFDPKSIMEYPVDPALTTNGYSIPWNTRLSDEDRRFVGTIYPFADVPAPAPPAPPPVPATPPEPYPALEIAWELWEYHKLMRALANIARRAAGLVPLPELQLDGRLYRVAARFAAELASRGVLTHSRASGVPFSDEITAALGHPYPCSENAAEGQRDVAEALASWMGSPGHRANVLGPYNAFGGAVATAADGTRYWVCDFASVPRP